MKLKHKLVVIFVTFFSLILPAIIQMDSNDSIKAVASNQFVSQNADKADKELLIFGYIGDAPPVSEGVGSLGSQSVSGYCKSLADYLSRSNFDVKQVKLKYSERFRAFEKVESAPNENFGERIKNETFAIECDPNSKTRRREADLNIGKGKGQFSTTFLTTSTKLLIKRVDLHRLKEDPLSIRIGVMAEGDPCPINQANPVTTTQVICNIYPSAKVGSFVKVEGRDDAIKQLELGKLDAYASDEIILKTIRKDPRLFKEDYVIEPKVNGFTREDYGIVFYNGNNLRKQSINDWIQKDKEGLAARKELEKQSSDSWILKILKSLISLDDFWILIGCLLFLLLSLLVIITHHWFIALIQKLPLFRRVLNRIKNRRQRRGAVGIINNYVVNVVNNIFCYVDRDVPIELIEKLAIQPRLKEYEESGLSEEKAKARVAKELAQKLENDPLLRSLFKTAFDAATEEVKTRIRGVVGWLFDTLLVQSNN